MFQQSTTIAIFIVTLSSIIHLSEQRYIFQKYTGTNMRREKGWIFLDRMVIGQGILDLNLEVKLQSNKKYVSDKYEVSLALVSEQVWSSTNQPSCEWYNSYRNDNVNLNDGIHVITVNFDKNTEFKGQASTRIQIETQTTYHIVAMDCKKTLINEYFNKLAVVQIAVNILSENRMHSRDQEIYTWLLPILFILGIASYKYLNKVDKEEHRGTDYPRILLKISLIANITSLTITMCHHLLYILVLGYYIVFLEFVEAFIDPISDTFLMVLIVFLSYGWFTKKWNYSDPQIFYAIAAMMGFSFVITNVLTKINDSSADKYHFHDSIPSLILIIFRIIILIIFVIGLLTSMNPLIWSKQTKQNLSFSSYQKILALIGCISILYMPAVVLVSSYVGVGWREVFVYMGLKIVKTGCLMAMGWLLTDKDSVYRKINVIDQSFFVETKGL